MRKVILILSIALAHSIGSIAGCYNVCLGNGIEYLLTTNENDVPIDIVIIGTCADGPWVHPCLAIPGPPDQYTTDVMLAFRPETLRPCTPEETLMFTELLKGEREIKYLDLKQLPQSTIDFLRSH